MAEHNRRNASLSDDGFTEFWNAYGRAIGGKYDRKNAYPAWKRLSRKDRKAALDGIAPYSERCRRQGVSMKYAQGYLNGRRWEDEDNTVAEPEQTLDGTLDEMEIW